MATITAHTTFKPFDSDTGKPTTDQDQWEVLTATVEYEYGTNIHEAIELFGEDVVFGVFEDNAIVKIQAAIRNQLVKTVNKQPVMTNATPEEIQAAIDGWKPGQVNRAKKVKEDHLEMLKRLKEENPAAFQEKVAALMSFLDADEADVDTEDEDFYAEDEE